MSKFAMPQDQALLATIARIAILHGQMEYILKMTVRTVEGLSVTEAKDATARQGSREIRQRIRKLAHRKLGDCTALVKLDALLNRAARMSTRRNALLHGLWALDNDREQFVLHGDEGKEAAPTIQELDVLAEQIESVIRDFQTARFGGFLKEALDARAVSEGSTR